MFRMASVAQTVASWRLEKVVNSSTYRGDKRSKNAASSQKTGSGQLLFRFPTQSKHECRTFEGP